MESNPPEADLESTQTVPDEQGALVIDRSGHPISRRSVPENVLKVLYRLHRSGFDAEVIGDGAHLHVIGKDDSFELQLLA